MLNGRPVSLRGVGLHEDDPAKGFAIDSARRAQIVAQAKELGATVIRSHYPLHPEMHELADRLGMLVWSEIPVYAVKTQFLKRETVRKLAARELEYEHHRQPEPPSIMLWSIGNELSSRPGSGAAASTSSAPCARPRRWTRRVPSVSPSRATPRPAAGRSTPRWTSSASTSTSAGTPAPTARSPTATRCPSTSTRCAPAIRRKAIFVSEFGAEANRDGPVEEKGTYAFQQDFVNYHLAVHGDASHG